MEELIAVEQHRSNRVHQNSSSFSLADDSGLDQSNSNIALAEIAAVINDSDGAEETLVPSSDTTAVEFRASPRIDRRGTVRIVSSSKSNHNVLSSSATSGAASWLEFTDWLERGLDEFGLEPNLYARCVLSILKQPPESISDISMDQDDEWLPTSASTHNFLSVVSHHHLLGKNNSAPTSRKNSFGSLLSMAASNNAAASATVGASMNAKLEADTRKQALLDCLKTVSSDETDLGKFVEDIVHRYSLVSKPGILGEKQNESVDSGVCPSPEESFQNYDEAFPPLSIERSFDGSSTDVFVPGVDQQSIGRILRPRVASMSSTFSKHPIADETDGIRVKSSAAIEFPNIDDGATAAKIDADGNRSSNIGALSAHDTGESPIKRAKLLIDMLLESEANNNGRELRSCPDFAADSINNQFNGADRSIKKAKFCCPVVKNKSAVGLSQLSSTAVGQQQQLSSASSTFNHQPNRKSSASVRIQPAPQFIVPKCWKVGSWPSRYDRSTKPAADVPFWSCSEWFCTVHKRLEFGLLNAKINGDAKSLVPPVTSAIGCCGSMILHGCTSEGTMDETSNTINHQDAEIFDIEPQMVVQDQQHRGDSIPMHDQNQYQQHLSDLSQAVPDMFDAPRFILHIINEDDAAMNYSAGKDDVCNQQKQPSIYTSATSIKNDRPSKMSNSFASPSASSSDWASSYLDQVFNATLDDLLFGGIQQSMLDAQYDRRDEDGVVGKSTWPSSTAAAAQPEFSFDFTMQGDDRSDIGDNGLTDSDNLIDFVTGTSVLLPVDVSRLANSQQPGGIEFCLPKCVNQQQQQQFLQSIGGGAAQNRPLLFDHPQASIARSLNQGDGQAMEQAIAILQQTIEDSTAIDQQQQHSSALGQQKPQSVAVPIRETTHFRPIRSESMEDAYFLKPGFDEFGEQVGEHLLDGYYVYQPRDPNWSDLSSTDSSNSAIGQQQHQQHQQQQQLQPPPQEPVKYYPPRRSLTLKFRASKPDKMCQTETNRDENVAADETNGPNTLLEKYRQEFEVWAFHPDELRRGNDDAAVDGGDTEEHMARWNIDESMESGGEPMVVGPLSPPLDEASWVNDLLSDSPPKLASSSSNVCMGFDQSSVVQRADDQYVAIDRSEIGHPPSKQFVGVIGDRPDQQSLIAIEESDQSNCVVEPGSNGWADDQQQQQQQQRQQLNIWQQEDERYEDNLLRYVSNISLMSPLDVQTTTV